MLIADVGTMNSDQPLEWRDGSRHILIPGIVGERLGENEFDAALRQHPDFPKNVALRSITFCLAEDGSGEITLDAKGDEAGIHELATIAASNEVVHGGDVPQGVGAPFGRYAWQLSPHWHQKNEA